MAYRPSVRYADAYKKYIEEVDESTHLDRNQIIRLALFTAAQCKKYQSILKKYIKGGASLPQAEWGWEDEGLWRFQNYTPKPINNRTPKKVETIRVINKGGIKYVPKTSPPAGSSVTK
ncbi:hypothetical protein [Bacillus salipaludis]|uniref:hypothetical protein n=1 Tax=Bacillus salipaludis TaxID=2547811 RepID=UPI002E20E0BC|nr:hypothetical protein [Bacillus salipaludis]